jgi:hypothetical protein
MDLEQHVRQLQEVHFDHGDNEEPSAEMHLCYRNLTKTFDMVDQENAKTCDVPGVGP